MSEATFPFRKVIRLVVVTWILSLVTILALVYFEPNVFPRTWHDVAEFDFEFEEPYREITNHFYVPSNHWRIEWAVKANESSASEEVYFTFSLRGQSRYFSNCIVTPADFEWRDFWSDNMYITGSGEFSIEFWAKNVWCSIHVDAYY